MNNGYVILGLFAFSENVSALRFARYYVCYDNFNFNRIDSLAILK